MSLIDPGYPRSRFIASVLLAGEKKRWGTGDMWPITWADDDNLYGGAGDNSGSPMNFWRIAGPPGAVGMTEIKNFPVDPKKYCRPPSHPTHGIKPSGLLFLDAVMYLAVEAMNYGDNPVFNRQRNIHGWIITSRDYGKTWDVEATPVDFFTGRLSSAHFLQFGKAYAGARDGFVYAYFPAGEDGNSYWENGDGLLLGRVPRERVLEREAWQFWKGHGASDVCEWGHDEDAQPVFQYARMTGSDHVVYNAGLKRYILGNYSFFDRRKPHGWQGDGKRPRPLHQCEPESHFPSQLTLFEAPQPWGPWSLFHRDDNWGCWGGYQPNFPAKWMSADGREMFMVYSALGDDYCLTVQRIVLEIAEGERCTTTK